MAAPSTVPTWMPLLLKILPVTTNLLRRPPVKGCAYWLGIARQITRFALFPLRLRQIDANVSKLQRPLGEPASALGSFFGRCGGINHLINRLCGQLSCACSARWRRLFSPGLDSQPQIDQPADSFRPSWHVILLASPF